MRSLAAAAIALTVATGIVTGVRASSAAGAGDAGAPRGDAGAKSGVAISRIPPDPPPFSERGQWIFDLRFDKGDIYLLGAHAIELAAPQATPRVMGRFAVELYEGPTLIERVRFDFPMLLAGDLPDAGRPRHDAPYQPAFDKKLVTRIGVMFPATGRGTRLELWDRATDRRWPLPWPPTDTRRDGG